MFTRTILVGLGISALSHLGCAPQPFSSGVGVCFVSDQGDLDALAAQERLACDISVENTEITSLDTLSDLRVVPGVILQNNPALDDIQGLDGVTEPFRLTAKATPLSGALVLPLMAAEIVFAGTDSTSITSAATEMGSLSLHGSVRLTTLSFSDLHNLSSLALVDLPELEDLEAAFPLLEEVNGLRIENCPKISSEEIDTLAGKVPSGAAITHCGNLDDDPC